MKIQANNYYLTNKKTPDYPQKKDNIDNNQPKSNSSSPSYDDYVDEYSGGGGGNYYEYSGPDGSYSYDPYH